MKSSSLRRAAGLAGAVAFTACAESRVRPQVRPEAFAPLPARVAIASYTSLPAKCPWWVGGPPIPLDPDASIAADRLRAAMEASGFLVPQDPQRADLSLNVGVSWRCIPGRFTTHFEETFDVKAYDAAGRLVWKDRLISQPWERVTDIPEEGLRPGFGRAMAASNDRVLSRLKLALGLR